MTKNNEVNKSLLLTVTVLANFFNPLLGAAVNVALPNIGVDFKIGAVQLSWITMSYLLASAVFLVPLGKAGDLWGRKKMFMYGNFVLGLASLMCGFAISADFLIAARLLQGIGGAMMFSTGMAIVISAFPIEERGKVIGLNVSAVYLGLSAAPVLGGILTEAFGWRSLFLISGVISLLVFVLVFWKIKAEWVEKENDKFDWLGALIYMPSMTSLMYGFSKLPSVPAIFYTLAGLIGLIFFVRVELKSRYPLLNMKLFVENKVFAGSNLSALINYAATFAVGFMLSLYLQYAKHLSPSEAGVILITQPALMALVAMFSGRLSDKINPRYLASLGMALSVIGLMLLVFITQDTSQVYIVSSLVVLGFGIGLFSSPNTNLVMSSVERRYYGVASATIGTMRTTGMMFSMAISSLSVHLFVGDKQINSTNIQYFIQSAKLVFLIFSLLCVVGVFLSLSQKKNA
ncbi:MAG: MFS transporter [Vallitaleaceae bacterium]|jgi:EmrB/QacA subfamily drug resistance transporter|nr:MFS transporter [Vallitaleaceae bacterium]